ncbi:MAG: NAD(P)H-dependent oxidoreductase [Saccharospirillaceae bacterium]|nr:NAD(P)H dehydrogenase [Thalassolituus sp. HI0120]MCH2039437.1 NAD(P)H-dependent oxidoreductase [Saccharospirillaceae bacterium]
MKRVLVINANPKTDSLTKSLANQYTDSVNSQYEVKVIHIGDLDFTPDLKEGYQTIQQLEPDLVNTQALISWAEHIVILSPVWWGTVPAKFKGLIDRTFLPGFAFKYEEGKAIPKKLLKGKTAEMIVTLDTPVFWYKYIQGNVIYKHLKRTVLDFSGIKNNRTTYFGPVISSKHKDIEGWHEKVTRLAASI